MGILDRILRAGEGRKLRALEGLVPDVNVLEPDIERLSDGELRGKTVEFRQRLDNGEDLDDLLVESFAVVREAAKRTIGQRHFDVQIMGGAALHFGWIAEMKTGEGKTLVSTLPIYLNALAGKGVHVITVNDYLARFQSEWMGRIYHFLGMEVGLAIPDIRDPQEKRVQYQRDITYGINNEFGFDYLRDNMAMSMMAKVQRGHAYAIVDEIDSILIDEARTPLIISGRVADAAKLYYKFASIARGLQRDSDYDVDEEKRHVAVLEPGVEKVESALGVENLYDELSQNLVHQLNVALKAKELYRRDRDYVVIQGEVKIVDEFTGRILEGRRWSEGLHQAVEAKEGVRIKEENQTLATITLQNYFRLYDKLAGMTGTAVTEAAEFASTYQLQVVPIPTNKPVIRADHGDQIYKTEDAKFTAVADDLAERYERGQPVLVGTISVDKSERLSTMLTRRGVPHEVLNAKQHAREAEIVAQAGRLHSITVATNMAGRGVDIILGGNPEGLARREVLAEGLDPEDDAEGAARYKQVLEKFEAETRAEGDRVRELGGLYVLATERHESRRIDNQLRGRSGRQGDPGESRFYLSLEDDLMRLFATGAMSWVMGRALPEDVPIEAKMVTKAIERAQNTVEARNAEIRKNVLKYDEVMNQQRTVIYRRRNQILEGHDLRDDALAHIETAVRNAVQTHCLSELPEEWDIDALVAQISEYYPTERTADDLLASEEAEDIVEMLLDEAVAYYESREQELGAEQLREIERQVMLQVIDTRWREHLYEMDYLQDGIHLRAMGQRDPLVEWQREGYAMFAAMVDSIAEDFVKYIMHVQVVRPEDQHLTADVRDLQTSGPEDPSSPANLGMQTAAALERAEHAAQATPAATGPLHGAGPVPSEPEVNAPVIKSEQERLGRNDPCWCGSDRKFKHCHGR